MAVSAGSRQPVLLAPVAPKALSSPSTSNCPSLHHRERGSPMKNRKRFEDSLESQAVILLARADGAGDLRCDHASDGRPVIGVTEEVKFSRAPHGCADYCIGRSRPRQNSEDANSGRPAV